MEAINSTARGLSAYGAISRQSSPSAQSAAVARLMSGAVDTSELRRPDQAMLQEALITAVGKNVQTVADSAGISTEGLADDRFSPDAVAERIFEFTAGLLPAFRRQNPDLSETELVTAFETTIRDAVSSGFEDARKIIKAVDTSEDSAATVDETQSKLSERYDAYFAKLRSAADAGGAAALALDKALVEALPAVEVDKAGPLYASGVDKVAGADVPALVAAHDLTADTLDIVA